MCSLCTRPALSVQGPLQTRRSSSQGDMHNHGRGDGWGGGGVDETEGRRVKHHIHMVLYIVPLSGILMGVLVLGLIFCVVTHKGNSRSSALQRAPPQSHIGRPRRRAVLCRAPQTDRSC